MVASRWRPEGMDPARPLTGQSVGGGGGGGGSGSETTEAAAQLETTSHQPGMTKVFSNHLPQQQQPAAPNHVEVATAPLRCASEGRQQQHQNHHRHSFLHLHIPEVVGLLSNWGGAGGDGTAAAGQELEPPPPTATRHWSVPTFTITPAPHSATDNSSGSWKFNFGLGLRRLSQTVHTLPTD